MRDPSLFKWRHFEADIILCAVRWYLRYALSYRDVEELLRERGVSIDHTTVFRWVQRYAPELDQRCRPHLKSTNDSYRVDETYIKINKQWHYLYRQTTPKFPLRWWIVKRILSGMYEFDE
jgi:transposase, IS6 family